MYIRKEEFFYDSFEALWKEGYRSEYFNAKRDDEVDRRNLTLSERLLFTQSNGRALLGHDARGRLHFLCVPHTEDYAIPSGGPRVGGQFDGHIGQFYQTDVAMLLGKVNYEIELAGSYVYEAASQDAVTAYLDHVIPVTKSKYPKLTVRTFSFAPMAERESRKVSSIHPLPGPAGAIYGMHLTNTGTAPLRGKVRLRFDQRFVIQNERFAEGVYEDLAKAPLRSEWDGRLIKCYHPEASAALQFLGAEMHGMPETPEIFVPFELAPGEAREFTTVIAAGPSMRDTDAALGTLYRHTALEWINITLGFWKNRFGGLSIDMADCPGWGERYRDMQLRFILDDFNCLSFDKTGRMLVNWQGAPSHGLSRLWGIDIEPTVISVLYAVPEIGPSAVKYMLEHNTPRYSIYPDHSTPILVAPLIMAGKYLELTGDKDFFIKDVQAMDGLRENLSMLMRCKHAERALFSSRYASDLITFNRYDYMTQVKAWVALKSYATIQQAIGEDPSEIEALMEKMLVDMRELMEADGPFGIQVKGGTNLGECAEERFYNRDDISYYCGEDSFTCMAPLYGLYSFDYEPWKNLHVCARSMFMPNYDPEYRSMRELHYGMNPSGTGNTLRLGGSVTRAEMKEGLEILFDRLDVTGSLFWWPRGENKRRVLTRCSQGQGSWIQQSTEQWLGLRLDAMKGELRFCPQGLPTGLKLEGMKVGLSTFDVDWSESEQGTTLKVVNRSEQDFTLVYGRRIPGAGAEGEIREYRYALPAGAEVCAEFSAEEKLPEADLTQVGRAEMEAHAVDGAVFGAYGMVMPNLYFGPCDIFQLRFVTVFDHAVEGAEVTVEVPEGWQIAAKQNFHWDDEPDFDGRTAVIPMKRVEAYRHGVAAFNVLLPRELIGANQALLSKHPFGGADDGKPQRLLIRSDKAFDAGVIRAELKFDGGNRIVELPVQVLPEAAFEDHFDRMIRG